jgi:hypothetical protein
MCVWLVYDSQSPDFRAVWCDELQGPVIAFVATLPTFTLATFNDSMKLEYTRAIQRAATGRRPCCMHRLKSTLRTMQTAVH